MHYIFNYKLKQMKQNDIDERLIRIEKATAFNKKVLTFTEGCQYLGISESYGYKLTSAGILPISKPNGKIIYFDREELEKWALSKTTGGSVERSQQACTYLTTRIKAIRNNSPISKPR